MSDYDNTNSITIWFKRPGGNERAPDIKVEINDGGNEVEYALWKRGPEDNPNGPAYKGKVERKHSDKAGYSQEQTASPAPAKTLDNAYDEDVPF